MHSSPKDTNMILCWDKYYKPIPHSLWQSDSYTSTCNICQIEIKSSFILKSNKHHCRFCGKIVCNGCSQNESNKHRLCDLCVSKKKELNDMRDIINVVKSSPIDPIKINDHEFMFIADKFDDRLYIYFYNTITNKWKEKGDKMCIDKLTNITLNAFNSKTNALYSLFGDKLTKISLKNMLCTSFKISPCIYRPKCIFINNELHIIGGVKVCGSGDSKHHYVWDDDQHKMILKWTFESVDILRSFGLVFLENKQRLYLFGGVIKSETHAIGFWPQQVESTTYITSNCIYILDQVNNKCIWKQLNVKMPYKAYVFGIISCKKEQYILLFMAKKSGYKHTTDIYIFDVDKEIFRKSLIECPIKGSDIKLFIPNDYGYKMSVLLCGYIQIMDGSKIYDSIPQDVLNLIVMFMCDQGEYLYVFGYNGMCKMSINNIVK